MAFDQCRILLLESYEISCAVTDIGEEWDPVCTNEGDWYYVRRADSREVSWELTPQSVGDWTVYWDVADQDWAWKHVVSREITMEAPSVSKRERVDEDQSCVAAVLEYLQVQGWLAVSDNYDRHTVRICQRRFLLKCHPDKCEYPDKASLDCYREIVAGFDLLLNNFEAEDLGEELTQDHFQGQAEVQENVNDNGLLLLERSSVIFSGVVLFALCDVLMDDCVSENVLQVVADLFIEKASSRAYGFILLESGEFKGCEAQLKSQSVYAETPADFIHVLDDDFFWKGLSWFAIAKYVRVQVQLWLDDGWAVPSRLRRGLPERGMARHEETGGCCRSCEELADVLLAGDMKRKLFAVAKAPCVECGVACGTRRKDWLKGCDRNKNRRVFCPNCLRADWILEHDWQIDFDTVLGSGTYGSVYKGKLAKAGMPIAVKCMDLTDGIREEVTLQQMCAHPNIDREFDSYDSGTKRHVALELCLKVIFFF